MITDKTYCLVTRSLGKIWLTKSQAIQVKNMIITDKQTIIIGDNLVMKNDIAGMLTGADLEAMQEEKQREKRGEWKCKHDRWHQRGEQCGHDGKHW